MNHVRVYSEIAIIYGYDLSFKPHASHAVKIIIADELISVSPYHTAVRAPGVIIKANTRHKVKSGKGLLISIYIDPHSKVGTELNNLAKHGILKLGNNTAGKLLKYFREGLENHLTETDIKIWFIETLLNNDVLESTTAFDGRIKKIIDCIRTSPNYNIKFSDLLSISGLSESRLMHLFKKEVGITIRKYVLWCRVLKALKTMSAGANIKQSARLTGFTDAAHLSRTFASMFGISPSSAFK